jgi:hypothetical protein
MTCKSCGAEVAEKFCGKCGALMEPQGATIAPLAGSEKTSFSGFFIGLILAVLIVVAYVVAPKSSQGRSASEASGSMSITYRVTGSATDVEITFSNESGGSDRMITKLYPVREWTRTLLMPSGSVAQVSAQLQTPHLMSGDVTVEILTSGNSVKTSTSRGEFAIASVSGRIP